DDAAPLSKNTARRITAHCGAADRRGQNCKFVDVVRNTDGLSLTLLLTTVRLAAPEEKARLPIPSPELPLRAQLLTVNVPPLKIPSPELPLTKQLLTVNVPKLVIPPELPLRAQLLTVTVPELEIPAFELSLRTQLLTVNVPWLSAPVPELLLMLLLATVMEAPAWL